MDSPTVAEPLETRPVDNQSLSTRPLDTQNLSNQPLSSQPLSTQTVAACPVARVGPSCPVDHRALAAASRSNVDRSPADRFVRKILRIDDRPDGLTAKSAYSTFQRSMLISAIRCTLTYVVFPFVVPAVGFATGVGPVIGIIIGVVAMTCDVFTIRRFFAVDHKWRWHFSAVALGVIGLLSVLLVQDILHLLR